MMILNKEQIKSLIPHRKPFLFIEECKIIEKGKIGESWRIFHDDEYFFEGHFPDNPIVPGVVIVEAMAQTAGVVVSESLSNNKRSKIKNFSDINLNISSDINTQITNRAINKAKKLEDMQITITKNDLKSLHDFDESLIGDFIKDRSD